MLLPENRPVDYDESALLEAMTSYRTEIIRDGLKDLAAPDLGHAAVPAAMSPESETTPLPAPNLRLVKLR